MMECVVCKKTLKTHQDKYCSNKCQHDAQYSAYIESWKRGDKDGNRGRKTRLLSKHIRRYLLKKHNEKCSQCGWTKHHPTTGKVPLEIDHIDGNANNSVENNLRLLCPNCHALTSNFRNLNRGHGRNLR